MDKQEQFNLEKKQNISNQSLDIHAVHAGLEFIRSVNPHKYSYNFTWMGRPIIQYPQDIVALQELIWEVKPDLIIETGIAHGGSLIFSASMLQLLGNDGHVLGIDIDIREHNRIEIEKHPMDSRITMINGSSIDPEIITRVYKFAEGKSKVLIILDSNHTHEHVLGELNAYAPLVSRESYLVVFDTIIEDFSNDYSWEERSWGVGNNPKTAVREFLKSTDKFIIDKSINNKLLISVAPDGYLKRVK